MIDENDEVGQQAADEAFALEVLRLLPVERRLEAAAAVLAGALIENARKHEGSDDDRR